MSAAISIRLKSASAAFASLLAVTTGWAQTPIPTPAPTPGSTNDTWTDTSAIDGPTATPGATVTPPTSTPSPTPPFFRILWEGFDAVPAPALPPGWTTSVISGPADCDGTGTCGFGSNWITAAGNYKTAPNAAFHDAPACVTDSNLDTPSIFIPNVINPVMIQFWQSYNLEAGHDGGVLEISIEGGPFTDIIAAGGSITDRPYNAPILDGFLSPITGRQAWTGNSGGYVNTRANLPNAAKNHNVVLRFRLATDCAVGGIGWYIDSIDINRLADPTPTATATAFGVTISGNVSYCSNPVPQPVVSAMLILTPGGLTRFTDASGNYSYTVASNGNYTITPNKAARPSGSAGIDTVDVLAVQQHFLNVGSPLTGCRLAAADVDGVDGVNTVDVLAIQRFFLGLPTGIANVGKYKFTPLNRSYSGLTSNQPGQNYDALVYGDVASPFAEP